MKKLKLLMISCLLALVTNISHAAEVWVKWGASEDGSGTMTDPQVVSTPTEFGLYMNSQPEDTTIHLLAGEFLTSGTPATGIRVKRGQQIRGAGIHSTIVKIQDGATGNLRAFYPDTNVLQHRAEISDMTIDCNLQGQTPPANAQGAALYGSDTRLSRIKVINWGSRNPGAGECFVMLLGYDVSYHSIEGQNNQFVTNCIIEDVVITQPGPVPHHDGTTGIMVVGLPIDFVHGTVASGPTFNVPSPGWVRGAVVRGCQLINIHAGTAGDGKPTYFNGFGVGAGTENLKLNDNYAIDLGGPASRVIYSEEAYFRNVTVENNFFVDISCAYRFDSGNINTANYMRDNLTIRDNYIVLRNDENAMNALGFNILHRKINNLTIANNYIVGGREAKPALRNAIAIGDSALNLSIEDNVIDAPGTNGHDVAITLGSTLTSFRGNRRQDGSEVSCDPSIAPPNGAAEVVFTPTQVGWYRLWQGCNYATARVLIEAGDINNTLTSLDFTFEMGGTVGQINLHRHIPYNGSAISKIRTAYDLPSCRLHYLDIHVQQVNGTTPIRVRFQDGGFDNKPVPTFLTSNPTPPAAFEERILNLGIGFRTSGALFSANTQVTDDVSGKVLPGALPNLPIASFNSGTGASANTFWRGDGTWASLPIPTTVRKLADDPLANDSTVNDDAVLKFTMVAGSNYRIRLKVFFTTTATADFKYQVTGPVATLVRRHINRAAGGDTPVAVPIANAYSASGVGLLGTGAEGMIEEEIIVHNTTSGSFVFRWAQDTSNAAPTIVRAGSYIEYMPFYVTANPQRAASCSPLSARSAAETRIAIARQTKLLQFSSKESHENNRSKIAPHPVSLE